MKSPITSQHALQMQLISLHLRTLVIQGVMLAFKKH